MKLKQQRKRFLEKVETSFKREEEVSEELRKTVQKLDAALLKLEKQIMFNQKK